MTVQNLYVKSPYVGNGTKRKFPITFEWLKGYTEHIQVFVRNKNGVLAQTTNYTLELDPSTNTYSVVYPTSGDALATGEKLIIVRELPLTQILNLVNQGPYFAEDIELTFDEVVMMIQQLNEKLGRSLKVGVDIDTDNDIDITVPVPTDDKNYGIRMTKNGFELVRDPQDAYDAAVAHNEASIKEMNDIRDENVATTEALKDEAEAAKTDAQNAASISKAWAEEMPKDAERLLPTGHNSSKFWAKSISDKYEGEFPYVTPEMFGAVGDGVTDDTQALQDAFDTKKIVVLTKDYIFTNSIFLKSDIYGNGILRLGNDGLRIYIADSNVTVDSITVECDNHTVGAFRIEGVENITVQNCRIYNVGNDNALTTTGAIYILNSNHINIIDNIIRYCHTNRAYSSYGINVEGNSQYIYIDRNIIDDVAPREDADGVKIMSQNKAFAFIRNNVFRNCLKRCLKLKADECYSENNLFILENKAAFGIGAIDFQRNNSTSINDKLVYKITDISVVSNIQNSISIDGDNIIVDGFETILDVPNGYTVDTYTSSSLFRVSRLNEEGASFTANNILIKNVKSHGFSRYFLGFTSNSGLTSIKNMRIENIEYSNYFSGASYSVFTIPTDAQSVLDTITVDGFYYSGTPSANYTLFSNAFSGKVNCVRCNIGAKGSYNNAEDIIEIPNANFGLERFRGVIQHNNKLVFYYKGTTPSNQNGSAFAMARNCPIGTKFIWDAPTYNETTNKLQIGFICTAAGDTSKVGTCVPLYENI